LMTLAKGWMDQGGAWSVEGHISIDSATKEEGKGDRGRCKITKMHVIMLIRAHACSAYYTYLNEMYLRMNIHGQPASQLP
jgi:hypothetical protein